MSSRLAPVSLVFTLSLLALSACDENTTPAEPNEQVSQTATTAASYSAEALEIPDPWELATATSINTAGQVVGYRLRPDNAFRGFIWSRGVSTDLGTLGGNETLAFDINDLGQVVGASQTSAPPDRWGIEKMRAFRWQNGVMKNLGSLGGRDSRAFGINKSGQIVGESNLIGNPRDSRGRRIVHAFLLRNGVMTDLGTLGGANSAALDINDAGQVVGWSEASNGIPHPFLWENGVMKDLLPSGSTTGVAYAISPLGVVVGKRDNRAFKYTNGEMKELPLGSARSKPSVATGIRNGRLVGTLTNPAGSPQGFVLTAEGVTLLPLLPGTASGETHAINGAGVIVGTTENELDGYDHVTQWTPQEGLIQ